MFRVVVENRKRRIWSPRIVAASAVLHLLLLAGFVTAAETSAPERESVEVIDITPPEPPKPAVKPERPETPPAPDKPQPVKGDFVTPRPPETVPDTILPPRPDDTPVTDVDVSGIGREGDVIGKPDAAPRPPTGATDPQPRDWREDGPYDSGEVTTLPDIANKSEAQRLLQRAYPPLLRDAGVTGRTTVTLIIDQEGKVEPGSVRVQDATHAGFEDAAVRAVERFRFRPATLNGRRVAVMISIPIEWQLESR